MSVVPEGTDYGPRNVDFSHYYLFRVLELSLSLFLSKKFLHKAQA